VILDLQAQVVLVVVLDLRVRLDPLVLLGQAVLLAQVVQQVLLVRLVLTVLTVLTVLLVLLVLLVPLDPLVVLVQLVQLDLLDLQGGLVRLGLQAQLELLGKQF
jgi:hypothetical protein